MTQENDAQSRHAGSATDSPRAARPASEPAFGHARRTGPGEPADPGSADPGSPANADSPGYASFVPAARSARRGGRAARGDRQAPGPGAPAGPGRAPGHGPKSPKPSRRTGLVIGGALAAAVAIVYLAGAFTFMDRFLPNTTIMGENVSLKTSAEVENLLAGMAKDYALDVSGQGLSMRLSSADVGMGIDAESVVDAMHADANPWAWPVQAFGSRDETDKLATSNGRLDEAVRRAVEAFNETAVPPRNAGLDYDGAVKAFAVRAETPGTALDADKVVMTVSAAVATLEPSVTLGEDALQQPTLLSADERLAKAETDANALLKANFSLKLADATVAQVNADAIAGWTRLRDDVTVGIDDGLLGAWVQDIASACNTYQARRTFTRADGKEVTVSGGVYGWIVDKGKLKETVIAGVNAAQTGEVAVPCEQSAGAFDGLHGRDWGKRYLDIDLAEQHARLYDDEGNLAWESDIVSGTPNGEHDTPEGVYVINSKESPSKLIGAMKPETGEPEYKTEVQAWMPFVDNIIGLHDAEWQSAFGGQRYSSGYGSHGCVNLPSTKATELYDLITVGDVVVCHW